MKIIEKQKFFSHNLFVIFAVLLSSGCSQVSNNKVDLSTIDLTEYIVGDGDLPEGVSIGQIRSTGPKEPSGFPERINELFVQLGKNNEVFGYISAYAFSSESEAQTALES